MGLISAIKGMFNGKGAGSSSPPPNIGNTDPVCPYCEAVLDKTPGRKKKCSSCGELIYVRTRPSDRRKILIREDQILKVEELWAIENGVYEQFLAERKIYNEKRELLAKKFGKEPSENDIQWSLLNKDLIRHAQNLQWGFYRNAKLEMADILKAESKKYEALDTYFEVCYIDVNGPSNCVTLDPEILEEFPPFDPELAFLAPRVIGHIKKIIEGLGITQQQAEVRFMAVAERTNESLKLPVSPASAWKALSNEIYDGQKQ